MAFTATTQWDVRTTGSDTNGGGFDTSSSGTDYSQQDAAQITYTDLVIDAAANTKCTSAANPFTASHVGNVINITSGTGFTVQRVQVVSVAAGVATCDKSLGTLSSTGGNGKLGGGLATINAALTLAISSNGIHIKAGTYTVTASLNIATVLTLSGYGLVHNDLGTKPLITTATNSVDLWNVTANTQPVFINLSLSNTASTRAKGVVRTGGFSGYWTFYKCLFDGFTNGIYNESGGGYSSIDSIYVAACELKNCTDWAIISRSEISVIGCSVHHNGKGVQGAEHTTFERSIIWSNSGDGYSFGYKNSGTVIVLNSTFANNGGDGLDIGAPFIMHFANNLIYGNTLFGVTASGTLTWQIWYNAYGGNGSGNVNSFARLGYSPVTLTANPFTNAGAGDFSLNSTAGGGAACKDAGYPGVFPGGNTTGHLDIGAAQSAGSSGTDPWATALPGAYTPGQAGYILGNRLKIASNTVTNTALNNFAFVMVDLTGTPRTGLTVTAQRSIDGGAYAACTNSVVEISNGTYKINLSGTDLNGTVITLRFTATGAQDRLITLVMNP